MQSPCICDRDFSCFRAVFEEFYIICLRFLKYCWDVSTDWATSIFYKFKTKWISTLLDHILTQSFVLWPWKWWWWRRWRWWAKTLHTITTTNNRIVFILPEKKWNFKSFKNKKFECFCTNRINWWFCLWIDGLLYKIWIVCYRRVIESKHIYFV